jgi:hypothetical protein
MCGGGGRGNSAAVDEQRRQADEARAREEKRRADVQAGTANIDQNFAAFDDNFYNRRRDAYLAYAMPQLDQQLADARRNLTFALGNAGQLRSSAATDRLGRLAQDYEIQRGGLVSQADALANDLRAQVTNRRNTLVDQLNASADPDAAFNNSLAAARTFAVEPNSYSPLGQLIGNAAQGVGQYLQGRNDKEMLDALSVRPNSALSGSRARVVK